MSRTVMPSCPADVTGSVASGASSPSALPPVQPDGLVSWTVANQRNSLPHIACRAEHPAGRSQCSRCAEVPTFRRYRQEV